MNINNKKQKNKTYFFTPTNLMLLTLFSITLASYSGNQTFLEESRTEDNTAISDVLGVLKMDNYYELSEMDSNSPDIETNQNSFNKDSSSKVQNECLETTVYSVLLQSMEDKKEDPNFLRTIFLIIETNSFYLNKSNADKLIIGFLFSTINKQRKKPKFLKNTFEKYFIEHFRKSEDNIDDGFFPKSLGYYSLFDYNRVESYLNFLNSIIFRMEAGEIRKNKKSKIAFKTLILLFQSLENEATNGNSFKTAGECSIVTINYNFKDANDELYTSKKYKNSKIK